MIIGLATNVFVSRWDNGWGFVELELVELGIQDVLDALVRTDAGRESTTASCFQATFAVVVPKAQEAQAGAVGLLWVLARFHKRLDELRCVRADGLCPAHDPLRRPLLMLLMSRGHVFRDGGVPSGRLDTGVGCNPTVVEKDLDCRLGSTHIDLFVDEGVGDAVVLVC
jgi:hypothetical protein